MSDKIKLHRLIAWIAAIFVMGVALPWLVSAGEHERNSASGSPAPASQKGLSTSGARFRDNGDGTVTDHLTGLVWLKDANLFGMKRWADAWNDCKYLADDGKNLRDGSTQGAWRLAYVEELQTMAGSGSSERGSDSDGTEGCLFFNVQAAPYWSWPTYKYGAALAWTVHFPDGLVTLDPINLFGCVWCVRDPH